MNLALTSLVILLLAVPGYVARIGNVQGKFTTTVISRNLTDDIIRAVMYSIPFHLVGIGVVEVAHHLYGTSADISFDVILRLLAGEYGKDGEKFSAITQSIYGHFYKIALYFFMLGVLGYGAGIGLRSVVWQKKLDVKWKTFFEYNNPWLYYLFGRDQSRDPNQKFLTYVDALVELEGQKTRLYRGVVSDFATDEAGMLRDIILIETLRGKFRPKEGRGSEFYWEKVPGNRFALRYTEVKSLNITYWPVPKPKAPIQQAPAEHVSPALSPPHPAQEAEKTS
jgi:hypothetical protein